MQEGATLAVLLASCWGSQLSSQKPSGPSCKLEINIPARSLGSAAAEGAWPGERSPWLRTHCAVSPHVAVGTLHLHCDCAGAPQSDLVPSPEATGSEKYTQLRMLPTASLAEYPTSTMQPTLEGWLLYLASPWGLHLLSQPDTRLSIILHTAVPGRNQNSNFEILLLLYTCHFCNIVKLTHREVKLFCKQGIAYVWRRGTKVK